MERDRIRFRMPQQRCRPIQVRQHRQQFSFGVVEYVIRIVAVSNFSAHKCFMKGIGVLLALIAGKYCQGSDIHPVSVVYPVPVLEHAFGEAFRAATLDLNMYQDPFFFTVFQECFYQHVYKPASALLFKLGE